MKKKSIYSNQKKIKRLKENNSNKNPENKKELRRSRDYLINSVNNNTISNEKDFILSNFETEKSNKNDNLNIKHLLSEGREKKDKSYNFNFYDSESDDLNNNNNSIQNKKIQMMRKIQIMLIIIFLQKMNLIRKAKVKTQMKIMTK